MNEVVNMNLHYVVPLVLHKIVRDENLNWEDIKEKQLLKILEFIEHRLAGFCSDVCIRDPRWMLTFDDGNISDYEIVFPLLMEKNIKATFFVIVDKIGAAGYVGWQHIREMHQSGMFIGSHSSSHRLMTSLSQEEAIREFSDSKKILEDYLGEPISSFSYPFGDCSSELHRLGFDSGYLYLFTSKHGVLSGSMNIIPRNSINSSMGWDEIVKIMNPSIRTRCEWFLEDFIKACIKSFLGREKYMSMRNGVINTNKK